MTEAPPLRAGSPWRARAVVVLIALAALAAFAYDLPGEPHFMDESAYITQSYFFDLYFGGDMEASIALGGQVMGRIDAVRPVADIIASTMREFAATAGRLATIVEQPAIVEEATIVEEESASR